ncbi:MAG TPA: hypothetical protein VF680_01275 [Allosphingosinicella sp.]|jgi:hypothetical protein
MKGPTARSERELLDLVTLLVSVPATERFMLLRTSSGFDSDHRYAAKIGRQVWYAFAPTAEAAMVHAATNFAAGLDNGDAPEANRKLQLRDLIDG